MRQRRPSSDGRQPGLRLRRLALHGLIVLGLTLLTQIGGIIYLASLALVRRFKRVRMASRWQRATVLAGLTALLYAIVTLLVVPPAAGFLGRVQPSCIRTGGQSMATTTLICALNRGYVRQEVYDLVASLGAVMALRYPGSGVTALEGGFPFLNGFPLLPHVSHDDGRKIDLAFFYRDRSTGARIPHGSPSPIGYFLFEQPRSDERMPCVGRWSPLRWSFTWLQPDLPAWTLDTERTAAMLAWLKAQPSVKRIFIEPYLADRLGVTGGKIRFQGCSAARHDDHVHVEAQ